MSKTKPSNVSQVPQQVRVNVGEMPRIPSSGIQTIWVDAMEVVARTSPPVITMRFDTVVEPSGKQEACRIAVSFDHVQRMIDVLAKVTNYYPSREASKPEAAKKKATAMPKKA